MGVSRSRTRAGLAAVLGGGMLFVAASCGGLPAGVDGDLAGGWGGFPEPAGFVPEVTACHADAYRPVAPLVEYAPVACEDPFLVQTAHVGTFEGDAAESEAPPEEGSAERQAAYAECDEQVAEFLGADFRHGRLWLGVATPSEAGWQGGARWFRCDLMEIESVYGDPVERQGSLAGALAESSELSLGCFTAEVNDDGAVANMNPVSCEESHDAEFVGVWDAPDGAYPDAGDEGAGDTVYNGCREQVAEYVDVPADGDLVFRTGTIADWMSEADWEAGDRSFRCYLWLPDRDLTESLAGDGEDALPIQTEE